MNKKLIVFSIIIAFLFSVFVYTNYKKEKSTENSTSTKIYFIQIGAYKNSDNVAKVTKMVNYNYVEYDNGIYYIYVGITSNEDVLNKLKKIYALNGNNIYIKEKEVKNIEFLEYLKKYDELIKETDDKELIDEIEKDILKKYEKLE